MSRIGIDLDGVCYDFSASLREYLIHAGIKFRHECPAPTRWEFYEDWGLSLQEFLTACHRGVEAGIVFSHGDPYDGTQEAFTELHALGHTVHVITDRSFGRDGVSEQATRAWLDRYGLTCDSLTFSADKTVVGIDYMVEDKLANYDALHAIGTKVYLLDRPWNQSPAPYDRITTLAEYVERVA